MKESGMCHLLAARPMFRQKVWKDGNESESHREVPGGLPLSLMSISSCHGTTIYLPCTMYKTTLCFHLIRKAFFVQVKLPS